MTDRRTSCGAVRATGRTTPDRAAFSARPRGSRPRARRSKRPRKPTMPCIEYSLSCQEPRADDFILLGESCFRQTAPFVEQLAAAVLLVPVSNRFQAGILADDVAHLAVDQQHFVNADPSAVTRIMAFGATFSVHELPAHVPLEMDQLEQFGGGIILRAALGTDGTYEALGNDPFQRRRDLETGDPHVEQTRDGAGAVVGVQSAEDEVPRQRGLNGDFRRF